MEMRSRPVNAPRVGRGRTANPVARLPRTGYLFQVPRPIYLDYNATTPLDPRVLDAMRPFLTDKFGNAASSHFYGWEAKAAVDAARAKIADLIGAAEPESVIFTSGTTESNNLAIKGLLTASPEKYRVISQRTEHECVIGALEDMRRFGHEVYSVAVDAGGRVNPASLKKALRPETALVSVMWANNEVGTLQDVAELVRVTRENSKALFHTDAAQAVGKIPVNVADADVDFLSFSAHKIYGPKGVGALYVAPRSPKIRLHPQLHGGGHEFGLRSGTLNVPGIVGFAKALELCAAELKTEAARQEKLRDRLVRELLSRSDLSRLNGPVSGRLPNNANVCFAGTPAGDVIAKLISVAVSSGAACSSGGTEPSHVLQALGLTREEASWSLRFSVGRFTTEADVDVAIDAVLDAVAKVRDVSPAYQMMKDTASS